MATSEHGLEDAIRLMTDFADRTGITSGREPRRYLWTDAFAVCNFLGLARATGKDHHTDLAIRVIDQVHHVLGRYRDDDSRRGWLSGLAEGDGEAHPTRGGLRIGKKLPERRPHEPFDDRLEWDRDGQYFHYLTKWMHALDQTTRATGDVQYNLWARELAAAAHRAFVYRSATGGGRQMVWKMSTDLSHPLVPSMGHHDPLDGLITYRQLQTTEQLKSLPGGPDLGEALADFESMCEGRDWLTTDPLGLGGLLSDALRVEQLMEGGAFASGELLDALLAAAVDGLRLYEQQGELDQPAFARLAFRELGLAIGLRAIQLVDERLRTEARVSAVGREAQVRSRVLARHLPLAEAIEAFWLRPASREARTWSEHRDINEVMLATSLAPQGFLFQGTSR